MKKTKAFQFVNGESKFIEAWGNKVRHMLKFGILDKPGFEHWESQKKILMLTGKW